MVNNNNSTQNIRILQYNVNKSRTKVLMGLLQDPEIASYDIIATQEPWRNPINDLPYNPRQSPFYTSDQGHKDSRICTYINKRIRTDKWTETHHSKDLSTVTLQIRDERTSPDTYTIRIINIHNVYNQQSSYSETQETESLRTLRRALEMPGEHVVLGDLNLHHPSWGGPSYPLQHKLADTLLDIVREADMELILPEGTITRDCQKGSTHEQTTIDLVFATSALRQQLIKCDIERSREQSSDHLPIHTEFEWHDTGLTSKPSQRRAWKKLDTQLFTMSLIQRTNHLENHPLTTRNKINWFTERLIDSITKAAEDSTPWARPSTWSKSYWTEDCQRAVRLTRKRRREFTTPWP